MNPSNLKNKTVLTFVVLFFGVIFLSSCLKNKGDDFAPTTSYFSVVNGFSSIPSIDIYVDNQKANTSPVLYEQNSEYYQAYSGARRLTITEGGTTSIIADVRIDLAKDKYYSVFLARRSAVSLDSIAGIFTVDDLTAPSANKAKIRLANLTPGAVKIDVYIKGADSLFANKGFASISAFKEIDPAVTTLEIRQAGQSAVKIEVPLTLQAGKIYTLSTNGIWTSSGPADEYGTQLTVNK